MSNKKFISGTQFTQNSFLLAKQVWESGFRPSIIVGLARGGYPIAMHIQEYFAAQLGQQNKPKIICVQISSYEGQNQKQEIEISGFDTFSGQIRNSIINDVLIVDDIFESGRSIEAFLKTWCKLILKNDIQRDSYRIATMFIKKDKNKTNYSPNFVLETTSEWVVFPHELEGLSKDEMIQHVGFFINK